MIFMRRCRRRQVLVWFATSVLFFCTWTFLTLIMLIAQEQFEEEKKTTTEDSYIGHGIQVVVGHYNGRLPDDKKKNLTFEQLNAQNYNPVDEGEMGRGVKLTPEEEVVGDTLWDVNKFNLRASDRIAFNRSLPDMRKTACREKNYHPATLPDTSVIIVYHNEAWSTLLRTVTSVINRSPSSLLKEIILVDDCSNRTFLGDPLDEYVSTLDVSVRIIRADTRVGLIRARLMGAKVATGAVLTFLDSHCECTIGWLEPLLDRIRADRTNVVCPVIDVINDRTFAYNKGIELFRGGFNWNLQFRWYSVPPKLVHERVNDSAKPIESPTMAGGLFSIDRSYFEELGTYDPHMDIWGGENLEISFRVWQCGGRVEILPCSHVGHVFRKSSPHDFPKESGGDILNANLVRVAEVWMDDWKHMFYKTAPQALKIAEKIDVSDRVELRERLGCKNFKWYLENVYFDHFLPFAEDFFGRIEHDATGDCAASTPKEPGKPKHTLGLKKCTLGFDMWQMWVFTADGRIKSDEHQCLSATKIGQQWFTQLKECGEYPMEYWLYDENTQQLSHKESGYCLDKPNTQGKKDEVHMPALNKCSRYNRHQLWTLRKVDWHPAQRLIAT